MDGFHAHSGWFFRRNPDASVTIHADDSNGEPREATFDANTWASIVSSVSSRGETAGTFRLATDFHGEASA